MNDYLAWSIVLEFAIGLFSCFQELDASIGRSHCGKHSKLEVACQWMIMRKAVHACTARDSLQTQPVHQ